MKVLIVEDEVNLAEALVQILKQHEITSDIVSNGNDGLKYALSEQYDAVILDAMLPGLSGFEVVRQMRDNKNSTPVIMLTAKDDVKDKVLGLDNGADDYMTKPFSPEELLARIRSVSRRQSDVVLEKLEFSDLILNLSTCILCCGNKSVHLGYKEFEVFKILISNSQTVVSQNELIVKIWGYDSEADNNNIDAYISFLRKKLSYLNSRVSIETIGKTGYKLEENV